LFQSQHYPVCDNTVGDDDDVCGGNSDSSSSVCLSVNQQCVGVGGGEGGVDLFS
jgi:hypothetical protein